MTDLKKELTKVAKEFGISEDEVIKAANEVLAKPPNDSATQFETQLKTTLKILEEYKLEIRDGNFVKTINIAKK